MVIIHFKVGMALVASCVVLRLYCRHSGFDQMPSWVKVGVLQWLAKITFTSKLVAKIDKDAEEKAGKVKDLEGGERCVSNGALVDHVSLLSSEWDSTYDIDTTEECPEDEGKTGQPWSGHKAMNNNATGTPQTDQVNKVAASRMHTAVLDTKDCICELLVDKLESRQKTLLEHVTNMTSLLTDQEIDEEKRKEWQLASSILDRSFLVFFIVALIVSSVAIFMQVPNK